MRSDAQTALVGLVDDRAVELWRELLVFAVARVDPDLHDVDLVRGEFGDRLARFDFVVDPIRYGGAAGLLHRDATACATKARGARNLLGAHGQDLVAVRAKAHRGADAV